MAHVTNQLLLQEWQPRRRGRVASPGCSREKEELKIGMANSKSTECFSLAARSSRVDLGQRRVGRNMTYFLRLPLRAGSGGQGAGAGLPVGNRELQREAPRPQAACARRRRKKTKAAARRTQSQRPARAPGPGRTRGRRPGRAQAAPCTCRLPPSQWLREAADARKSSQGKGLPGLGARNRPGPESSAAADHRTSEPARPASQPQERRNPVPWARGPHAGACGPHSPARFAYA